MSRVLYRYWQGQLNPDHVWFADHSPALAHKIVRELPGGLAKMAYWLSRPPEFVPQYPMAISADRTHITGVAGNTRLMAAILQRRTWPTILRLRDSPELLPLITSAEPLLQLTDQPAQLLHSLTGSEQPKPPNWDKDLDHWRRWVLASGIARRKLHSLALIEALQQQVESL